MKSNIILVLGIVVIVVAQMVFRENDNSLWVPRIILTIVGVAIAGMAWDARKGKKK